MDKQGVTRSVCGVESVPPAFYSIVSLTRLRRGPGDLQAQFLPPPRLRGPVGRQPGVVTALLAALRPFLIFCSIFFLLCLCHFVSTVSFPFFPFHVYGVCRV